MRIAVVGVGAMGSLYAAHLSGGSHEVWAVDQWSEHIAAIQNQGLLVTGVRGEKRARPKATTTLADVGPIDLAIIATKSADVPVAALAIRDQLAADGVIVTIQNGIGAADKLPGIAGSSRIILGVAGGFAATMKAPGHVHHYGWHALKFGEYNKGMTARLEAVARVWREGGFDVETFADLYPTIWEKLICNVAFNGPCALTGMTVGQMLDNANAMQVSAACAREAYAVAIAKGIALNIGDPVDYAVGHSQKIRDGRPSTAQDHLAHRKSEIDEINGAIAGLAAEVGLTAPTNAAVAALIRARETLF